MSSPDPVAEHLPPPNSFLLVEGDPTVWGMNETDVVSPSWLTDGEPVELTVVTPLSGALLLAPRRAGSLVLYPDLPHGGWIPCTSLPSPYLYLPSTTGVAMQTPGYRLGPDTNINTLKQEILTAMRTGTLLKVSVSIGPSVGTVLLNGAHLPFVVLADAELTTTSQ
jgi:hypothetical protein